MSFIWMLLKIAIVSICSWIILALPFMLLMRRASNREWESDESQQRYMEKRMKQLKYWEYAIKFIAFNLAIFFIVNWLMD